MVPGITHCIGIDGGGTKTEGVLTDLRGRVLCVKKYGPSNPNDVGLETAVELIASLVEDLLKDGGVSLEHTTVFAGISGALAQREIMTDLLRRRWPAVGALAVHSDVINLLAAEAPTGEGACLICGTGSVCFVRKGDALRRIGGWGYLLDGGGSGYDIGRMALSLALRAHDGRADAAELKPLTDALTAHLGGPPHEMMTEIYKQGKPLIAACAPVVFDLARQGDHAAERILDDNAFALAECITAALDQQMEGEPLPVILGGSICVKEAPLWTDRIRGLMTSSAASRVILQISDAPPVLGALIEAMAQTVDDRAAAFSAFKQAFLGTYLP